MLVGLVKWAYRRGEMHERLRIKRAIDNYRNRVQDSFERYRLIDRNRSDTPAEQLAGMDEQRAIEQAATTIIRSLVEPHGSEYIPTDVCADT